MKMRKAWDSLKELVNPSLQDFFGLELCTIEYDGDWIGIGIRKMIADNEESIEQTKSEDNMGSVSKWITCGNCQADVTFSVDINKPVTKIRLTCPRCGAKIELDATVVFSPAVTKED